MIDAAEVISVEAAAQLIGVNKPRVWQYVAEGRLGRKTAVGVIITASEAASFRAKPRGRPPAQK